MTDTQWPRYMVFQQEGQGEPFVHNGTVHAPDPEMALQNARDVFARRPEAVAMWVVRADLIFTQTREELAAATPPAPGGDIDTYYVFAKFAEQAQCKSVGEVHAVSAPAAIQAAIAAFGAQDPIWWWVFPASAVHKSDPQDSQALFATARDRGFTDQAAYPVVTMMRQIRAKGRLED
jgi:ring-1,2-phenylacetyl-CoA epoxidase subunit PaaB